MGVFLVAYGVSSQAILHPNYPFNATIIQKIFYIPYFNIYGELFLAEIQGKQRDKISSTFIDQFINVKCRWIAM